MTPETREALMLRYDTLPRWAWDELRHGSEEAARAAELRAINRDLDRQSCLLARCAADARRRGDFERADAEAAQLRKLRDAAIKLRGKA